MVLVKLFLRRYLIRPKLNSPLVAIYSLILSLVHSIGSSSYKVLNSDLGTVVFLCFLTYTPLVYRNVRSFQIVCWLQSLKVYSVKLLKFSLQTFHSLSSLKLQALYLRILNFTNSLMSSMVALSDCRLMPLCHFFYPALTYALISNMLILVL